MNRRRKQILKHQAAAIRRRARAGRSKKSDAAKLARIEREMRGEENEIDAAFRYALEKEEAPND